MEIQMYDILIEQIKSEVTRLGVKELRTPEEVDATLTQKGTVLVFVNSVCGCAGGIARPALGLAMKHSAKPEVVATVFASGDREATMRARSFFTNMPPSSPSFALLRDGKLVHMIHRSDIEIRGPQEVASMLIAAFDKYCATVPQNSGLVAGH
ncbi:MAG: BrxA/BrxB family bacilliredoxin [Ignavibacteria bacterium]|nr:BrxA/BrxB family bacilliredoxin [Ignavibacteria bacterium]MBI3766660.1 BrxA/BrxB family bacilliredoxin [Ignavibacteriales bacterium]